MIRATLLFGVALVSAAAPHALVATPADETSPATNGTNVAWTRGSRDGPVIVMKLGSVLLRRDSGRAVRITPPGVLAASGGMDTRTLVVQLVRNGSDLELFDLKTRRFRAPPEGVNTRAWEWRGSIFGRNLLFGRFDGVGTYDVVLADLTTGSRRVLDTVRGHGAYAEPGQVNARYAVWAGCPDNFCTVYRYDLRSGRRIRVPGDYAHAVSAPSVAPNGDVYYGRGRYSCGGHEQLMRYRPGAPPRVVLTLENGYDFRFTSADERRVIFDRVSCAHGNFDVYSIRVGQ